MATAEASPPPGAPASSRPLDTSPLLSQPELDLLRRAVADYTVAGVQSALGPAGQAALARGDVLGARRARDVSHQAGLLTALFVLGETMPEVAAAAALAPLPVDTAEAAGLVLRSAGEVRAAVDLRPYAETPGPDVADAGWPHDAARADGAATQWWLVSDLGSDVRPGPVRPDHVLGVGGASLTLAQATPRDPVERALDIGTGCGVQALHLGRHASHVTATDLSTRALRMASTTAALSGQDWRLRAGSLLDPVEGERFDLVVANPPFVVSPGQPGDRSAARLDYRDSGLSGDEVSRRLVTGLPRILAPGGSAQLLANWLITRDATWDERVGAWLAGTGCDASVWQREVADPGEYVELWLRDGGEQPGDMRWAELYATWRDWFDDIGAIGIGMGLVTMWQTDTSPIQVLEDVPQPLGQPVAPHIGRWPHLQRWLARTTDADLLDTALRADEGLALVTDSALADDGWVADAVRLRQRDGLRWEIETDDAIGALVASCRGSAPVRVALDLLADAVGRSSDEVAAALVPVLRDLIGRGILLPPQPPPRGAP